MSERYVNVLIDLNNTRNKCHKFIFELTETGKKVIGDWGSLDIFLSGNIFSPNSPINLMDDGRATPSLTKKNQNAEVFFLLGSAATLPADVCITVRVILMPSNRPLQMTEEVFTINPQ